MTYPYEDISNVDRTRSVDAADALLVQGWGRREYPVVSLDGPIPWTLQSESLRSWNFYIHCWDMLDTLLKAHSEGGDSKYLALAVRIARDWITRYGDPAAAHDSPFAWYDMAVGVRSYRLAYIADMVGGDGTGEPEAQAMLLASLEVHARFLADDANIKFSNNHGYYQVAGQLAMGRRFAARAPLFAEALAQGRQRLLQMLDQQFAGDGVHREHSPDYHRMVYDTLKALIDAGLVDDDETRQRALAIEAALSWFVTPGRRIVNFGDSDHRVMTRKPEEAARKWATNAMRHVVTAGAIGQAPAQDYQAFPESGYFIVRRPSAQQPDRFDQATYLAQTAAFHSRTHKHADDLSFVWSDRGSELLVDAGRYGYLGKAEQGSELWHDGHWYDDPNRVYCESTRAHNTLEFDGRNYPRKRVKPYGSALKRWARDEQTGVFAVETECRHFTSIRRVRVLALLPGQWLLVFDWFHDNAAAPHTVRQWFHLAPQLGLRFEAGGDYVAEVPGSAEPLRATALLDGCLASRPYLAEAEPVLQGWWSGKERDIVPAYAFCHERVGVSSGSMATLFSFSQTLQADRNWSKANVTGRRAQLRWQDEQGRHELRLDRGDGSTALEVNYTTS